MNPDGPEDEDAMPRYQLNEYFCGPAALATALHILGLKISQVALAEHTGTTEAHGTDEDGIKRAILALGYSVDEFTTDLTVAAFGWVKESVQAGRPVVLCVDHWGHWVTIIGWVGERVILWDPSRMRHNTKEQGLHFVDRQRLQARWEAGKRTRGRMARFYGVAVGKP